MRVGLALTSVPFVSSLAGCSYAESVGATHFLTSAKQNKGLEECFLDLTASE